MSKYRNHLSVLPGSARFTESKGSNVTQDIQVKDADGKLARFEDLEEWEPDGNEDIPPSFPEIKIVQATSKMPGATQHIGQFFFTDTEQYFPTITVVALAKRNTRALFRENAEEPACMSADGAMPLRGMEFAGPCNVCPMSSWGAEGETPPCRESYVLLVECQEDSELRQLRIKGKSLRPYRQFVARRLSPKHLPIYTYSLELRIEEKIDSRNKWFELRIASTPIPDDLARQYSAMLREQRGRLDQAVTAAVRDEPEGEATPQWGDGSASVARDDPAIQ